MDTGDIETMTQQELSADYLVIGSGAMGMAFTDVLMTESEATVVMVDQHHRPGGHWNDAYPFVRLHQPSAFYGVNSRKLGNDTIQIPMFYSQVSKIFHVSEYFGFDLVVH